LQNPQHFRANVASDAASRIVMSRNPRHPGRLCCGRRDNPSRDVASFAPTRGIQGRKSAERHRRTVLRDAGISVRDEGEVDDVVPIAVRTMTYLSGLVSRAGMT
jgi:hypothetical protein